MTSEPWWLSKITITELQEMQFITREPVYYDYMAGWPTGTRVQVDSVTVCRDYPPGIRLTVSAVDGCKTCGRSHSCGVLMEQIEPVPLPADHPVADEHGDPTISRRQVKAERRMMYLEELAWQANSKWLDLHCRLVELENRAGIKIPSEAAGRD